MGIEDLLGRIADALVEGNEINQKRLELCEEMLAIQKERTHNSDGATKRGGESETQDLSRDALLVRCAELNSMVPKGTKTATLPRLIADAEARAGEISEREAGHSCRTETDLPAESVAKEVAPVEQLVGPASEAHNAPAEPPAERTFETFESLAELRAACKALLHNPKGDVTPAESAAATKVYSRYGNSLSEIPQERWGEFYHDLKKAFGEAHANG